ncbi:MAG: hypothetical protein E2O72_02735 [Candidatus Dadabacteria bacterium]|nr:MAG: hypothetical protein E2O72_02735 [Candidatus Dadabacteria bacterium]
MKKYFLLLSFIFCLATGLAISEENKSEETPQQSDSITDQTESEKDCRKVCVKRDGYGMCTEFEELCEENP